MASQEHQHLQTADTTVLGRSNSIMSHGSEQSQTAADFIVSQLSLEAEAKEALPYQFDTCTKPLGPLRQSVYACLTCAPPPASKAQQFTPAGVCYSCSISCHGEHNLVELFSKRDFVCDCGTSRLSNSNTPCSLRFNEATGRKGGVTGEPPRQGNKYNQNFQGIFCGCGEEYDPEKEKGTMFQCLGLGIVEDGGCGEDWWHPECLMGLPRTKHAVKPKTEDNVALGTVQEESEDTTGIIDASHEEHKVEDEALFPEGFPPEDDFDHLICYKCVDAFPWIKQYAGSTGFLPAVPAQPTTMTTADSGGQGSIGTTSVPLQVPESKKRKADHASEDSQDSKKVRTTIGTSETTSTAAVIGSNLTPKHANLPSPPSGSVSLFINEDFHEHMCRCSECFPRLSKHPQLLEEEEAYEPPVSESDVAEHGNGSIAGHSVNSGSLLDRGEAALSSIDRVRAIEGVMAYNHVRDKVKAFLQPFAESGQPVGAEDIKTYFAKLRGDEQAIREAGMGAANGSQPDQRREQGGY